RPDDVAPHRRGGVVHRQRDPDARRVPGGAEAQGGQPDPGHRASQLRPAGPPEARHRRPPTRQGRLTWRPSYPTSTGSGRISSSSGPRSPFSASGSSSTRSASTPSAVDTGVLVRKGPEQHGQKRARGSGRVPALGGFPQGGRREPLSSVR